jgi:hypothetical protein
MVRRTDAGRQRIESGVARVRLSTLGQERDESEALAPSP